MKYTIETENLTKEYGTTAVVDHINLHIPKGQIYGLLGRNGAGKTTAMKMMLQLVYPSEGSIYLFGKHNQCKQKEVYGRIGSIIETPGFYSNLTGYENLQILASLRGGIGKDSVREALCVVGLEKENKKVLADYSLGMKQRLGIAAAIMHQPELLILDEPINGLDPIGISEMRSFLLNLSREKGTTILISSHVLNEIEQLASIIGVMHQGKLIEEVNMEKLHKRNQKYIEYQVSDTKTASALLKKVLNITDFKVESSVVKIFDIKYDAGEINKVLVENGISVSRITDYEENLEEYFSSLIGGGTIA